MPVIMTLTVVGSTALLYKKLKSKKPAIDFEGKTCVELLPMEGISLFEPPISSVTFFEGDAGAAVEYLRDRVSAIVEKNPWLGGWLQIQKDAVKLFYDETGEQQVPGLFRSFEAGEVALSSDTPYEELGDITKGKGVIVGRNADVINTADEPLWRVSVMPDAERPDERFALIMSLSHMLGDGHTYYRLYNMLSADEAVEAIDAKRKEGFVEAVHAKMGKKKAEYMKELSSNPVWEKWREANQEGQGMERRVFLVSDGWVDDQIKFAATETALSANDVITSWFWSMLKANVGLMIINLRNRLPMCTDDDAGNYLYPVPFSPEDYASPGMIRQAIDKKKKSWSDEEGGPGTFVKFSYDSTFSISTNWSTFAKDDLTLGDGTSRQSLHMPLYSSSDLSKYPHRMSMIMLFKAGPGKLGAFVLAPKSAVAKIEGCGIVETMLSASGPNAKDGIFGSLSPGKFSDAFEKAKAKVLPLKMSNGTTTASK